MGSEYFWNSGSYSVWVENFCYDVLKPHLGFRDSHIDCIIFLNLYIEVVIDANKSGINLLKKHKMHILLESSCGSF